MLGVRSGSKKRIHSKRMPRRRKFQSQIDLVLAKYGVTKSGRVGTLSHLTPEQFTEFRKLQRIGTKDPKYRRKFERRLRRIEARMQHEHSFVYGIRFNEEGFRDWYANPANSGSDGLEQIEDQAFNTLKSI